jgi:hypothetical protein
MANTEFNQVLSGAGTINRSALLNALEQRGVYVVEDGENPQDLTPGAVTTIAYRGVIFWYDSADALTAHDGTSCIVTADGKRFKSDGFAGGQTRFFKIVDKDLATPPGSPTIGNSYIVAAGGTGAWATHDKHVATYTARGWRFVVPNAYDLSAVIDESLIYHYSAGGAWTSGFPFFTIGANTVLPSALKYGRFGHAIVNQTTNTPPGSPSDGDAYIIGPSPTGAWATHAAKIAIYESSAWVIYTPYEGATVYDKALNLHYVHTGSVWQGQASGYVGVSHQLTAALIAGATNLTGYTYSTSSAPTTANANEPDTGTLAYTARRSGAVLEITYECDFVPTASGGTAAPELTVGLQVDSDAAMTDWAKIWQDLGIAYTTSGQQYHLSVTFFVTAPDTSSHTYGIRFFGRLVSGSGNARCSFSRRRIIIRERA